jgi:hypothetical protein
MVNLYQQAKTDEEWQNANDIGIPAWCYYDNEEANGINYGKLYNWHAVKIKEVLLLKVGIFLLIMIGTN